MVIYFDENAAGGAELAELVQHALVSGRPFALPRTWRVEALAPRYNPVLPGARELTLVYVGDSMATVPADPPSGPSLKAEADPT